MEYIAYLQLPMMLKSRDEIKRKYVTMKS